MTIGAELRGTISFLFRGKEGPAALVRWRAEGLARRGSVLRRAVLLVGRREKRMRARNVVAVGTLVAALASARSVHAQSASERVTARQLMDDGDTYSEQRRFAEALRVYTAAHAIMHVPTTGIELARTYAALGRLVEARDAAFEVTRMPVAPSEPKAFAAARRQAAELDEQLGRRIPTLRLELTGGADMKAVHASIDEVELAAAALELPQRVNPGKRIVRVRAAGFAPVLREVEVSEGAATVVRVELGAASTLPFGLRPLAFAGLTAAAVGVTVGSITGLVSLNKASDARTACGPDIKACDPSAAGAIDASRMYGWVATTSFAIAIAGGGLAAWSLLSRHDDTRVARLDVVVTAGGAGVRGTF
jgi:hypothetical protein